jgi:predicted dehydrogenase
MMKPVTIGIVGAGFVAHIHARAYRTLRDLNVHLGAVTALPPSEAEKFAQTFEVARVCQDVEELLARSEIDLVDLCVPNHLHAPFSIAAAQAGKHIICEKPLTGYFGSLERQSHEKGNTKGRERGEGEAVGATPKYLMMESAMATGEEMLATAHAHGVKLMYAENWLYSPVFRKALRLVGAAGGTILEIRAQESHSGSHASYAKQWRYAGGGALMRVGPHPLGAAMYLKQQEGLRREGRPMGVKAVMAETSDLSRVPSFQAEERKWLVTGWQDVENWATVILTFEDGTYATVHAADTVLGGMEETLEIFLSNGRVACDMTHSTMIRAYAPDPAVFADEYIAEKLETKAGWSYPAFDEEWLLGYPQELRDFVGAVSEGRPPLSDGRLGLEVARVIYAAYQSAEEGRRIEL